MVTDQAAEARRRRESEAAEAADPGDWCSTGSSRRTPTDGDRIHRGRRRKNRLDQELAIARTLADRIAAALRAAHTAGLETIWRQNKALIAGKGHRDPTPFAFPWLVIFPVETGESRRSASRRPHGFTVSAATPHRTPTRADEKPAPPGLVSLISIQRRDLQAWPCTRSSSPGNVAPNDVRYMRVR